MSDWLLDPEVAYLNHGAFGALPRAVSDAANHFREHIEREPTHFLVRELPSLLDNVRDQLAEFLGADPAGCAFVANATSGAATVLASLAADWKPGDELVVTDHSYVAVSVQVAEAEKRHGVKVRIAKVDVMSTSISDIVGVIAAEFSPRTRLVVVDSVASASGMSLPVREIVAEAHALGIPIMVDAAHAPGHISVDIAAIDADFWVGNLHKWICSPRAAAFLSIAPKWRDRIRPLVASHGFGSGFHDSFDWTGTFDPTPVLAVPAALAFWQQQGGWDVVRQRQRQLVTDGAAVIAAALNDAVVGPLPEFAGAMRIIPLPVRLSVEAALEVSERLLEEHRIEAPLTGFADWSWVRVCGQIYNDPNDYQRLADALPKVLKQIAN